MIFLIVGLVVLVSVLSLLFAYNPSFIAYMSIVLGALFMIVAGILILIGSLNLSLNGRRSLQSTNSVLGIGSRVHSHGSVWELKSREQE